MFIWFSIFVYFLVIDFFIFKQNWFMVILSLSAGFIIFLFYLLVKLIVGPKNEVPQTEEPMPSEPAPVQQPAEQPKTVPQPVPQPAVIKPNTVLTSQAPKPISLPVVFFVIEIVILAGLTIYLIIG